MSNSARQTRRRPMNGVVWPVGQLLGKMREAPELGAGRLP
jgi:hypothetical protein